MTPVRPLRDSDVGEQRDREEIARNLFLRHSPKGVWKDEPQATRMAFRALAESLIREGFPDAS